jgi:hypothetical protein
METQVPAGLRDMQDLSHGMLPAMESYAPSFPGPVFDPQIALQSLLQRVGVLEAALQQARQPENLAMSADAVLYPVAPQLSHLALAQNMYAGSRGLPIPPLLSAGHTGPAHELANTLQTALTRAHLLALAHSVGLHESTHGLSAGQPKHASKAFSYFEARMADMKELPPDKKPPVASEDGCTSDSSSSSVSVKNSTPRPKARVAPARKQTGGHRSQWSAEEHQRFLAGLARFGPKDKGPACATTGARVSVGLGPGVAEVIAVVVGTRTVSQVRSHAQKYFLRQTRMQFNGTQSNA